ncbi:MAG: LysR family transcriptional regulator [Faecalispora jeddahensis]
MTRESSRHLRGSRAVQELSRTLSISKYRAFIKVAESGSLTKAAKQLGYSQPGISHMVDSLETEMGFPLLIRNKDKIVPTENGKKVLYYCYQIIKNETYLQETVSAINGLLEGYHQHGRLQQPDGGISPPRSSQLLQCLSQY